MIFIEATKIMTVGKETLSSTNFVNLSKIEEVASDLNKDNAIISFGGGNYFYTKESYREVKKIIKEQIRRSK